MMRFIAVWLLTVVSGITLTTAFALPKRSTYGKFIFNRRADNVGNKEPEFQRKLPSLHVKSTSMSPDDDDDETDDPPKTISSGLVAIAGFASVSAAAKFGLLSGGDGIPYTDAMILRDLGSAVLSGALATVFIKVCTLGVEKGYLEPRDSRKIIHTFSAPLFMLFWPLFSASPGARYFAGVVPLVKAVRLYAASQGGEKSLANAVSRSGDREEAAGGPFVYVIILGAAILAFWRSSPVGIVALSTLAAGDGLADLIGRRFGQNNQWPGLNKSVAGSLAFWVGSTVTSVGVLEWMRYWDCLTLTYGLEDLVTLVACITFASAAFELVPVADDNYTVPLSAALMTVLLLQ